jgi:hypothetical protein
MESCGDTEFAINNNVKVFLFVGSNCRGFDTMHWTTTLQTNNNTHVYFQICLIDYKSRTFEFIIIAV